MIAMTSNPFSIAAPHALAADSNVVSSDIIPRDDGGLSGLGGVIIDPRVLGGLASGAKSAPPMAEHVHLFASSNAKLGSGGARQRPVREASREAMLSLWTPTFRLL